jgi:hypothetical protein
VRVTGCSNTKKYTWGTPSALCVRVRWEGGGRYFLPGPTLGRVVKLRSVTVPEGGGRLTRINLDADRGTGGPCCAGCIPRDRARQRGKRGVTACCLPTVLGWLPQGAAQTSPSHRHCCTRSIKRACPLLHRPHVVLAEHNTTGGASERHGGAV